MKRLFEGKRDSKINRRISAIMAGVLIITAAGTVTLVRSHEVSAKETLDSITRVVEKVTKADPYTILEIVPDTVSYDHIEVHDIDGKVVSVSGNQIMGFTGYYIGGEEPVINDIVDAVNDKKTEVNGLNESGYNYTESVLNDSNLRYELAGKMFAKLSDAGILGTNGDLSRRYVLTVSENGGYYEVYESELSQKDLKDKLNSKELRLLEKDYTGNTKLNALNGKKDEKAKPYIDRAKGAMNPAVSGNYIMRYDMSSSGGKKDIASEMVVGYALNGNNASEYSLNSLKYTGVVNSDGVGIDESAYASRVGDFDPALSYFDDYLADTMTGKGIEAKANTRAVFGVNEGARYGYVVSKRTRINKDNVLEIKIGTPLYRFNGSYYTFVGYCGANSELTLTEESMNSNSLSGSLDNDRIIARYEVHLNDLVMGEKDNDILVVDSLVGDENSIDSIVEDTIEDNTTVSDKEDSIDINVDKADGDEEDTEGNGEDSNEPENNEPEEEETDDGLYVLEFRYNDSYDFKETYYTVMGFDMVGAEEGAQYFIDTESEKPEYYAGLDHVKTYGIVNADCAKGSIGLVGASEQRPEDLEYFVFEYSKGNGSYDWVRTKYGTSEYENAKVYRVKNVNIYYGFGLKNNEWFKQNVFDREADQCKDLPVSVTNKKVSNVTEKDIVNAKLVVLLSGDASLCLGDSYTEYNKNKIIYAGNESTETLIEDGSSSASSGYIANDLSIPAYKKLVERMAINKVPVIGDYRIVSAAQQTGSNIQGSWVYNLVRVLMLKATDESTDPGSGFKIYYEAIGDELGLDLTVPANQFDPEQTTGAKLDTANGCHFVNQNVYVYNMKWELQSNGDYQRFLNPFFYTMEAVRESRIKSFTEDEINNGFKEVLEDIRTENRYRKADNRGDKLLDEVVTQATSIRYIIGFGNKRERNLKGKLRVLEIEPTNSFDLYIQDNGENYNNFGMSGHSYDTKSGFNVGSRDSVNDSNKILYRNGKYESINENNRDKPTGKLYRRNGWNDVAIKEANVFINLEGVEMELTRMSVAEFIGHIEDLNATYDLIYIGMTNQLLNTADAELNRDFGNNDPKNDRVTWHYETQSTGPWWNPSTTKVKVADSKVTVYNDSEMRGLIYTNIGDERSIWPIIASDDTTGLKSSGSGSSERYSGNDITLDSVKKIMEFVDASYPVILDDGFFVDKNADKSERTISSKRVDSASYMYQLANNIKDKPSVYSVSEASDDKDGFFEWLLNLAKPEIVIKEGSPAYEATKKLDPDDQLLSSNPSNFKMYGYEIEQEGEFFYLPFEFSIENKGAASSDSKYEADLYVDLNADGKYSTREKVGFTSINEDGYSIDSSASDLRSGHNYYAIARIASSFEGVVPWRIVVYQTDHTERRSYATGYYTLKKSAPVEIKVLQLNQRDDRGGPYAIKEEGQPSTWNMQATAYRNGSYDNSRSYTNNLRDHTFGNLLKAISNYYEVKITTQSSDVWESTIAAREGVTAENVSVNRYYEDLRQYDMLILGFSDCYLGPASDNASKALAKYIKSERSVLFTHDCTSFFNYDYFTYGKGDSEDTGKGKWLWGYKFNRDIRNIVGMDRYAVMPDANETRDDTYHPYDVAYIPGSATRSGDKESSTVQGGTVYPSRGITNQVINQHTYSASYTNINGINMGNGQDGGGSNNTDPLYGNSVTQVNDGQITKFPFALHDSFTVTPTHSQYYQLDFTDDADHDGEKDIVVWYCISDSPTRDFDGAQRYEANAGNQTDWWNGQTSRDGGDMYEMSPNDVRNNYYIYNKGNIVYTGVGHKRVVDDNGDAYMTQADSKFKDDTKRFNMSEKKGMSDNTDEIKLFINTMIAAYRRGIREPKLRAVRGYTDTSVTGSIYISYDQNYTNNTTGVLDDNVDVYFTASRSNYNTSDVGLVQDDLRVKLYWEATEEEKNAGNAVELAPMSIEYDASNRNSTTNNGEGGYPAEASGIYGIPVTCTDAGWWNGSSEIVETVSSFAESDGNTYTNGIRGLDNIGVYKLKVSNVDSIKSRSDGVTEGENLWYAYDDSLDPNSIQRKSLNNRRLILMVTNDTYNERTDIGRKESAVTYVTLTRAKMFWLE